MRLDETIASDGASSVVAVVTNGNGQILMGRSTDADKRNGKWCFTGGGIKSKECTIEQSAERECWEESGLRCRAQGIIQYGNGFAVPPSVVFVLCITDAGGNIKHNNEFSEMKWVRPSEALNMLDLFEPNRAIIEKLLDHPLTEEVKHVHRPDPELTSRGGRYLVCKCGAVRGRDEFGYPDPKDTWHICDDCRL
jgi:8-oxo-dGTP pyrophosphatase MutT (NUDIX family)